MADLNNNVNLSSDGSVERFGYKQELNRALGLPKLLFYGLAFMNLMGYFSMYGLITEQTHGMYMLAYTVAGVVMIFIAFSYKQMAKAFPISGSAYAYTSRVIHPMLGYMTGWAMMLDYCLLPMLNAAFFGIFMHVLLPTVPQALLVLFAAAFMTFTNIVGIKFATLMDTILTIVAAVFIFAFLILIIRYMTTGDANVDLFSAKAIYNPESVHQYGFQPILGAAAVLCLNYLGFDGITTLTEETKNSEKKIGQAIILTCVLYTILAIIVTYLMTAAWPNAFNEMQDPDSGTNELAAKIAGSIFGYIFSAIMSLSVFLSGAACMTSGARLVFGMGRDKMIPQAFAKVHPKFQTPHIATLAVGIVTAIAALVDVMLIASIINFGALLGYSLVNICVIKHYWVEKKEREGLLNKVRYLIAPIIATLMSLLLWTNLDKLALTVGIIWVVVGFAILCYRTKFFKELPPLFRKENADKIGL